MATQLSLANSLSLTKHYVQINTWQHLQAVHIVIYQQKKKIFQEIRVPKTSGSGEKKEELVAVYYDLSDFR